MRTGVGRTNAGVVRTLNQDSILILNESIGCLDNLFIVADGMGGHRAGEIASKKATEFFALYFRTVPLLENYDLQTYIMEGVLFANKKVFELSMENEAYNGMGTTFSTATVKDGFLYFAHIGDSRIYAITNEDIKKISQDHSFVAEMVRKGTLTESEASKHPNKNVLTRALGTEETVLVDTGVLALSENEQILICSDGLSNMVSDESIFSIMKSNSSSDDKADLLVSCAIMAGGFDNISLIIF